MKNVAMGLVFGTLVLTGSLVNAGVSTRSTQVQSDFSMELGISANSVVAPVATPILDSNILADETKYKVSVSLFDHNDPKPHPHPGPSHGSYYDWGRAQNGYGYCYEWSSDGYVLNNGQPVSEHYCENVRPSYYYWGQAQNGWGYCYHYTPSGIPMNQGQPVSNYTCERVAHSHYQWGRAQNGYTYCYQYTPNGYAMNQGQPVSNHYCR